jgi:hypothetical protein
MSKKFIARLSATFMPVFGTAARFFYKPVKIDLTKQFLEQTGGEKRSSIYAKRKTFTPALQFAKKLEIRKKSSAKIIFTGVYDMALKLLIEQAGK